MFRRKRCTRKEGGEMKKAVISVLVGTAVLAFVACGKNAATENSSDSGVSTVSASSQVEMDRKQPVWTREQICLRGHRRIPRPVGGTARAGHIIRRRIIRRHIIQTRIMIKDVRVCWTSVNGNRRRGIQNGYLFFYLSGKQYNAILNMNLTRKARQVQKKQPGFVSIRGHVLQVTRAEWRKENDKRRIWTACRSRCHFIGWRNRIKSDKSGNAKRSQYSRPRNNARLQNKRNLTW